VKKQFILTGQVFPHSIKDEKPETAKEVENIVKMCAERIKEHFLSPVTMTEEDSFQGISKNFAGGIHAMIAIEEYLIERQKPVSIRYVLYHGQIESKISKKSARGIYGKGLASSRIMLDGMNKKYSPRFQVKAGGKKKSEFFNTLFTLYQMFADSWNKEDCRYATAFLNQPDYKRVAHEMGKHVSLMWKREKSLKMKEYRSLKDLIDRSLKVFGNK
jgi:hypothetical protein